MPNTPSYSLIRYLQSPKYNIKDFLCESGPQDLPPIVDHTSIQPGSRARIQANGDIYELSPSYTWVLIGSSDLLADIPNNPANQDYYRSTDANGHAYWNPAQQAFADVPDSPLDMAYMRSIDALGNKQWEPLVVAGGGSFATSQAYSTTTTGANTTIPISSISPPGFGVGNIVNDINGIEGIIQSISGANAIIRISEQPLAEAPNDGVAYVRANESWASLESQQIVEDLHEIVSLPYTMPSINYSAKVNFFFCTNLTSSGTINPPNLTANYYPGQIFFEINSPMTYQITLGTTTLTLEIGHNIIVAAVDQNAQFDSVVLIPSAQATINRLSVWKQKYISPSLPAKLITIQGPVQVSGYAELSPRVGDLLFVDIDPSNGENFFGLYQIISNTEAIRIANTFDTDRFLDNYSPNSNVSAVKDTNGKIKLTAGTSQNAQPMYATNTNLNTEVGTTQSLSTSAISPTPGTDILGKFVYSTNNYVVAVCTSYTASQIEVRILSTGIQGGTLLEAPANGTIYGRRNKTWVAVTGGTGSSDISPQTIVTGISDGKILGVQAGKVAGFDAVNATTSWGAITGTLSNQSDLNSALAAKYSVPFTGIPVGDLSSAAQDSLTLANTAVQPAELIPFSNHVADSTIHVTAAQKSTWDAKQSALNAVQMDVLNISGLTQSKYNELLIHAGDLANPHQTTLQQAADQSGSANVVLQGRLFLGSISDSNKILTSGEIAGLAASGGLNYAGYIKYATTTLADMSALTLAASNNNLTDGDQCFCIEDNNIYEYSSSTWSDAGATYAVNDMYLIQYYYGEADGVTYSGNVQAELVCTSTSPNAFDRYLDIFNLLDGSVTDQKLGLRTIVDNPPLGHMMPVTPGHLLTEYLQVTHDNTAAALSFQNTMDKLDSEYVLTEKVVRQINDAPDYVTAIRLLMNPSPISFTYTFKPMYPDGVINNDYYCTLQTVSSSRIAVIDGTQDPAVQTNLTENYGGAVNVTMPYTLPTCPLGLRWKLVSIDLPGGEGAAWDAAAAKMRIIGYSAIKSSDKANKVVITQPGQAVYDFLASPLNTAVQSLPTDTITTTITQSDLDLAVATLFPNLSAVNSSRSLAFRSISGRNLFTFGIEYYTAPGARRLYLRLRTYNQQGQFIDTEIAKNLYASATESGWVITNLVDQSFQTSETYVNTPDVFEGINVPGDYSTWKELDIWKRLLRSLGPAQTLDLKDVYDDLSTGIQETHRALESVSANKANLIIQPAITYNVKEFLNLPLGTTYIFDKDIVTFSTTLTPEDLLEMVTLLKNDNIGISILDFKSNIKDWWLRIRFQKVNNQNLQVFTITLHEKNQYGEEEFIKLYDVSVANTANTAEALCQGTFTNITSRPFQRNTTFVNSADAFEYTNNTLSYLEVQNCNFWRNVKAIGVESRKDLIDVQMNVQNDITSISAAQQSKANKIVQQSFSGMTLKEYFAKERPTTYAFPQGTQWTTAFTAQDIINLGTLASNLGSRDVLELKWESISGDFYFNFLRQGTRAAQITVNQKKPDGTFLTTSIYAGPVAGTFPINNLSAYEQIDWLQFINYNQSFNLTSNIDLDIEQIRALPMWEHISVGSVGSSTKDLIDVQNDIYGDFVAFNSNMNMITVDGVGLVSNNIPLHQYVETREFTDLLAHPEDAQLGVIYHVPGTTFASMEFPGIDIDHMDLNNLIDSDPAGNHTFSPLDSGYALIVVDAPYAIKLNQTTIMNSEGGVTAIPVIANQTITVEGTTGVPTMFEAYYAPALIQTLYQPQIIDYAAQGDYVNDLEYEVLKSDGTPLVYVDGKQIYERSKSGTITTASGGVMTNTLFTGIDNIISESGWFEDSTSVRRSICGAKSALVKLPPNIAALETEDSGARTDAPYFVNVRYTKP